MIWNLPGGGAPRHLVRAIQARSTPIRFTQEFKSGQSAKYYTPKKGKMNKGLSKLQKFILFTACEASGNITNRQVIIGYYGFETVPGYQNRGLGRLTFDVQRIGSARYHAAAVAVVKSFDRLVERGLARRVYNHGIYLTGAGRAAAKSFNQMLEKA